MTPDKYIVLNVGPDAIGPFHTFELAQAYVSRMKPIYPDAVVYVLRPTTIARMY